MEGQEALENRQHFEPILKRFSAEDQAKLTQEVGQWLNGMTFDRSGSKLLAPPDEFPNAERLRAVLSVVAPGSESEPTVFLAMQAMLRTAIDHPDSFHALSQPVRKMTAYFQAATREHTRLGLRAIADGRYEQIGGGPLFAPVLFREVFQNLTGFMREAGFFDLREGGRKKIIIVNGRYRTGSTKVFGAVQAVLRFSDEAFVVKGADFRAVDDIITNVRNGAYSGQWVLIKTHNWLPLAPDQNVITLYTRRNIADVAASNKSLWLRSVADGEQLSTEYSNSNDDQIYQEAKLQKLFNEYVVPNLSMHVIDYDDYLQAEPRLVEHVAGLLGTPLDPDAVIAAARQITPSFVKQKTDRMALNQEDVVTLLRSRHISETLGMKHAGLHNLSPRMVSYLRQLDEWPFG